MPAYHTHGMESAPVHVWREQVNHLVSASTSVWVVSGAREDAAYWAVETSCAVFCLGFAAPIFRYATKVLHSHP